MKLFIIITILIIVVGAAYFVFENAEKSSIVLEQVPFLRATPSPHVEDIEQAINDMGSVPTAPDGATEEKSEQDKVPTERNTLTVSYKSKVLGIFPDVTEKTAREICAIAIGEGVCAWGTDLVHESVSLEDELIKKQFTVTVPHDDESLRYGLQHHIEIHDPGATSPQYRIFAVHKDLLGRINGMYETQTTNTYQKGNTTVFEWYLQEKHINEHGREESEDLPEGHYQLVAVDTATGRVSSLSDRFRAGNNSKHVSNTTRYGANTPLADSYWSGRGLFVDGGGGEDTVALVGNMNMYDIFKGVDFPKENYENTIIFVQGGNVVITVVNVEIIEFDNTKVTTAELMQDLNRNNGTLYRTEAFIVD